ncbi:siphovirus Gp157 family protein, partial [Micromonospora taraxaci]|uniref:siphovirus Gp157 family protein n=1 Tax=Micromonospora taraxaci TaxID=1316803 RepID=UPI00340E9484
ETRIERLREFALKVMDWTAQKKIELPEATLSIRMGQPAVVGEPDADALPDHLCRIKREPNKSAIKEALQNGRTVPGCELSNGQPSIAIRIK